MLARGGSSGETLATRKGLGFPAAARSRGNYAAALASGMYDTSLFSRKSMRLRKGVRLLLDSIARLQSPCARPNPYQKLGMQGDHIIIGLCYTKGVVRVSWAAAVTIGHQRGCPK